MSSVTFGSVGDIISVCLLAKEIVETLDNARGASVEYRDLITELRSLEKALLEVELVARKYENSPNVPPALDETPKLIEECRATLAKLYADIRKYDKHLVQGSQTGLVKQFGMKLRWQMSAKARIADYRRLIAAQCNALSMMLATANVTLAFKNQDLLEISDTRSSAQMDEQKVALVQIRQDIQHNVKLSMSMTGMIRDLRRKFEYFAQLFVSVKTLVDRGVMINLAVYRAVLGIQESLSSHADRSLIHGHFILEDAMGRVAPVHLQFVNSWNAFDAVLVARFKGLPSADKVQRKEFGLQERATKQEITRERPWEATFRPGQFIDMSIIFDRKTRIKGDRNRCPHCWADCEQPCADDVSCSNCGIFFRRVTELVDIDAPPISQVSSPWKKAPVFGRSGFSDKPIVYGPERKRKWKPDDWHDLSEEMNSLKRVRILTTEERIPNTAFMAWGKSPASEFSTKSSTTISFASNNINPAITTNEDILITGARTAQSMFATQPKPDIPASLDYFQLEEFAPQMLPPQFVEAMFSNQFAGLRGQKRKRQHGSESEAGVAIEKKTMPRVILKPTLPR